MTRGLAKSAGLIGLATLSSRILGLVRDVVTANFFGTSAAFSAFTVATRVPALLRELFAEGAMSAAFVPTLTRKLEKDGKMSEDDHRGNSTKVQELTDKIVKEIDQTLQAKEAEIQKV